MLFSLQQGHHLFQRCEGLLVGHLFHWFIVHFVLLPVLCAHSVFQAAPQWSLLQQQPSGFLQRLLDGQAALRQSKLQFWQNHFLPAPFYSPAVSFPGHIGCPGQCQQTNCQPHQQQAHQVPCPQQKCQTHQHYRWPQAAATSQSKCPFGVGCPLGGQLLVQSIQPFSQGL